MARRRSKLDLSLFPFLNILFALIAVLILHIFFILQINRVEGGAMLRARIQEARGGDEQAERRLSDSLERMREQVGDLERHVQQAAAELEQRKLLLELRQRQDLIPAAGTGSAGVPIGAPVPKEWRIIPTVGGNDNLKRPILVEVQADHYVVHRFQGSAHTTERLPAIPAPPKPKAEAAAIPLQAAPELKKFLDDVNQKRRDQYLLFLIRPDGIESFDRIETYCTDNYPTPLSEKLPKKRAPADIFDYGYEPYSDQWLLIREAKKP
jgi:hypothetical protein